MRSVAIVVTLLSLAAGYSAANGELHGFSGDVVMTYGDRFQPRCEGAGTLVITLVERVEGPETIDPPQRVHLAEQPDRVVVPQVVPRQIEKPGIIPDQLDVPIEQPTTVELPVLVPSEIEVPDEVPEPVPRTIPLTEQPDRVDVPRVLPSHIPVLIPGSIPVPQVLPEEVPVPVVLPTHVDLPIDAPPVRVEPKTPASSASVAGDCGAVSGAFVARQSGATRWTLTGHPHEAGHGSVWSTPTGWHAFVTFVRGDDQWNANGPVSPR